MAKTKKKSPSPKLLMFKSHGDCWLTAEFPPRNIRRLAKKMGLTVEEYMQL